MINNLELINNTINYIEEHLTKKIDYLELARISRLSVYEFRRIFSFIIGYAPAEYIRKRRLTNSAMEIKAGAKLDDNFAEKYGYSSTKSFIRAFKEYYGITPQNLLTENIALKTFNPPSVSFNIEKENDLDYAIETFKDYEIMSVNGLSTIEDTVCCESVWNKFNKINKDEIINNSIDKKTYAVYYNSINGIICHIGIKVANDYKSKKLSTHLVKGGTYISFTCSTEESENNINKLYKNILLKFLPYSPFVYDKKRANIEIFPLNEEQNFKILIPIIYKNN